MRKRSYVMKFVRMFMDMPSWSRTLGIWSIKSSKGIAKLFRAAMKSLGSTNVESGLGSAIVSESHAAEE